MENENLLEKAQRLGIKPAGQPVGSSTSGESLIQKAQRLGMKPGGYAVQETRDEMRSRVASENQNLAMEAQKRDLGTVGGQARYAKDFVSGLAENLSPSAVGLGKSIASVMDDPDKYVQAHNDLIDENIKLRRLINERESKGIDARDLKKSFNSNLDLINEQKSNIEEYQKNIPTAGKVLAQAGGTLLDILSAGKYGAATKGMKALRLAKGTAGVPTVVNNLTKTGGFIKGAAKALPVGYAYDVALGGQGIRGEDRTGSSAFIPGIGTAVAGTLGGVLGADTAAKAQRATKATALKEQIRKNAVSTFPEAVKAGEIPAEMVYPEGTARINPDLAQGRIDDVAQNLNIMKKGLGDKFRGMIDPANTSFEELTAKAEGLIDNTFGGGLGKQASEAATAKFSSIATKEGRAEAIAKKLEEEIYNIENSYVKTRKALQFSKDENASSRARIARADVLNGAVDAEGTIRTTGKGGAVDQYYDKYLAGTEGVVRKQLENEGASIAPELVRANLRKAILNSGLEGSALTRALNAIDSEIEGLMIRSTPEGLLPLTVLHDAKISTTKGINFNTEPHVKTGSKALANAYKTIIENNSKTNVKEVNKELSKYLKDIELLESLDGRKVKGGRLGKYVATLSGNLIGGALGSVAGAPGAAIGGAIGGDVASRIQSKAMRNVLSGTTGLPIERSPIIEKAVQANKNPVRGLLPAPKEGQLNMSPIRQNQIPTTIQAIKSNIKPSVPSVKAPANKLSTLIEQAKKAPGLTEAQKTALGKAQTVAEIVSIARSFGTPKKSSIVEFVRELIKEAKKNPEKGSVNFGAPVGKKESLLQEAKKYKSAEEFVNNAGAIRDNFDWSYLDDMKARKAAGESYSHSDFNYLSKIEATKRGKESRTFYRAGSIGKNGDIWLTPQEAGATQYGSVGGTKVGEYKVATKNPLILQDVESIEKILGKKLASESNFTNSPAQKQAVIDYAKKNGYDSVLMPDSFPDGAAGMESLVVWDRNLVKTKSQLTNIWNKANKKPSLPTAKDTPHAYSWNGREVTKEQFETLTRQKEIADKNKASGWKPSLPTAKDITSMSMDELKTAWKNEGPHKNAFDAINSKYKKEIDRRIKETQKSSRVTKTSNNLYHVTKPENIESIKKEGLVVGKPARYSASSRNKISFSANEEAAQYYGNDGDVMIRTKTSYKPKNLEADLLAGGEGVYTTNQNIPPEMLEIKVKGKWRPLVGDTLPTAKKEVDEFISNWTRYDNIIGGKNTKTTYEKIGSQLTPEIEKALSKYKPNEPITLYRFQKKGQPISPLSSWSKDYDWVDDMATGRPDAKEYEILERTFKPEDILVDIEMYSPDATDIGEVIVKKSKEIDTEPLTEKQRMFREIAEKRKQAKAILPKSQSQIIREQNNNILLGIDSLIDEANKIKKGRVNLDLIDELESMQKRVTSGKIGADDRRRYAEIAAMLKRKDLI